MMTGMGWTTGLAGWMETNGWAAGVMQAIELPDALWNKKGWKQ
jgi:hypothetical protein